MSVENIDNAKSLEPVERERERERESISLNKNKKRKKTKNPRANCI